MKAILTLTALLMATPAAAQDPLPLMYKEIAVGILQVKECGIKLDEKRIQYLASLPSRYNSDETVTMAAVGGMVYAYREMLNASGAMDEFCRGSWEVR